MEETKIRLEGAKTYPAESQPESKTGQGRGRKGGSINQMNTGKSQPFISRIDFSSRYICSQETFRKM